MHDAGCVFNNHTIIHLHKDSKKFTKCHLNYSLLAKILFSVLFWMHCIQLCTCKGWLLTSDSGRWRISSTLLPSPLAAALTSSSFTSPDTCVSNSFFSSALSRSNMETHTNKVYHHARQNTPIFCLSDTVQVTVLLSVKARHSTTTWLAFGLVISNSSSTHPVWLQRISGTQNKGLTNIQ